VTGVPALSIEMLRKALPNAHGLAYRRVIAGLEMHRRGLGGLCALPGKGAHNAAARIWFQAGTGAETSRSASSNRNPEPE